MAKVAVGRSTIAPEPKDWRFQNRAWKDNLLYHRMCQAYLACSRTALDLVDDAHFDWRMEERAKLATSLLTAALAPTNLPLLNPDVVERAYETGGRSVVKGLRNISRDVLTNRGFPRSVDRADLLVGRDLALTPGAVVFRNEVCELLQYSPSTETVSSIPLVMVPPMINKYYFMDMSPGRSYVEFCVQRGIPDVRRQLAQPDRGASGLGSRHVRRRRPRSPAGRVPRSPAPTRSTRCRSAPAASRPQRCWDTSRRHRMR